MPHVQSIGALIALVFGLAFTPLAYGDNHPARTAEDVEVIRSGGINMWRYRDENGDMVVVDRPPPQFFNTREDEQVAEEAAEEILETPAAPEMVAPPPVPVPAQTSLVLRALWLLTALLLLGAVAVWLMPLWRRWRGETPVDRACRLADWPVFRDLKIPGVGGRYVIAERVVRTPAGLVVVALSKLRGELRGKASADQWVCGTTPVANPLKPVDQAVEFLQAIVPEVPVMGRVVDQGSPSFAAGKPDALIRIKELEAALQAFEMPGPSTRTLDGSWRSLMKLPRSNQASVRPMGAGPVGWVRRHPHQALSAALGSLALVMAITLVIVQLL